MFDLPGTPSFPVYGLDDRFEGYRWLVIWNDRERLYTVSLGHGGPPEAERGQGRERAEWLTVSTYLKTPPREINDGPLVAVGPTGYQDALFAALLDLADRALPHAAHSSEWVTEQINLVEWGAADERNAPEHHGPDWVEDTVIVGGGPRPSVTRRINDRWATLVDLPTVALAITGPDSMSDFTSVVDVRTRLTDYN